MANLIDKSALVAEIERRKADAKHNCGGFKSNQEHLCDACQVDKYNEFKDIIDTLEVKEVDLKSEIKKIQKEYKTIDEYDGYPATIYASGIERIAKHFFELGMQVSNK